MTSNTDRLTMMAESASKCREVRVAIDALRRIASKHNLTLADHEETEGVLLACENLLGTAWAGFHAEANKERIRVGLRVVPPYSGPAIATPATAVDDSAFYSPEVTS